MNVIITSFFLLTIINISLCAAYFHCQGNDITSSSFRKRHKLFYSTENFELKGEYSSPIQVPSSFLSIFVKDSLFLDCTNTISNGGAISVNSPNNPQEMYIEKTTFHKCTNLAFSGEGGALFFESGSFFGNGICFSSCLATKGIFASFSIVENYTFQLNLSSFHSNQRVGTSDGFGSLIVISDSLQLFDGNFTNSQIGDQGGALYSIVTYEISMARNSFSQCFGKSIIQIVKNPTKFSFILSNFIQNTETGDGIISSFGYLCFCECLFHKNKEFILISKGGEPFLYKCVFDHENISTDGEFPIRIEQPTFDLNFNHKLFGQNVLNTYYCQGKENGGNIENIYTPSRSPFFDAYVFNFVDIISLACIGLCVIFIIFLIISLCWFCCCAKPRLTSTISYLKSKNAADTVEEFLLSSSYDDKDYENSVKTPKAKKGQPAFVEGKVPILDDESESSKLPPNPEKGSEDKFSDSSSDKDDKKGSENETSNFSGSGSQNSTESSSEY
ncbi:hypothetical protein TRFO_31841 [Tritrichomonas foetus]|uniref:Right handed beta helix domain-containing protein n=1 Tax=Tritrichomonas foetus TaxID=1144522 RepID=A0A1J4JRM6_9EUKA|nr:hypothetical protein TRFO_31841 [Tritrichomonas foetus]|eukprot:OHT01402.1 hypothetical protein TRFO_31841 [Tritrichomonas foetus]